MNELLNITSELTLPSDVDARRVALVGMSGSGKTTCARVIVERVFHAGRRVAVIDPNGVWHGIKTSADGVSPGLPFVLFGGRYADVPLEASAGAAVADLVMDEGLAVVLDLSGFEDDTDGLRVAADFLTRLRFRQDPSHEPLLLVVDEADLIAPQTARKEESAGQRALINIAKRSRADGLGLLAITQRPVGLATSILNQMEAVFLLRFTGYNDLDRVKDWLGSYLSAAERDQAIAALPSLSDGECFVTSPAWMRLFARTQFPMPETFDSSATPKAGERHLIRVRADVDLSALAARFASAIEAERENDPQELKRKIAELQQQLRDAGSAKSPDRVVEVVEKVVDKVVLVPVLEADERNRLEALIETLTTTRNEIGGALARVGIPLPSEITTPVLNAEVKAVEKTEQILAPVRGGNSKVSSSQQIILNMLAEMAGIGLKNPLREYVALFANVSPTSSTFAGNLTELKRLGLLDYPASGRLALTREGTTQAVPANYPLTQKALHSAWLRRLSTSQANLLKQLIVCYPKAVTRPALAGYAGVSVTSSTFAGNLTTLKNMGLVNYPGKGKVSASAVLFPKGLPAGS